MGREEGIGTLLGGGALRSTRTGEMVHHLGILGFDPEPGEPRTIAMGFLAHGITPSPHDPARLLMFEKHGPGCAEVDLGQAAVVRTIPPGKGREFYGHGVFSADGAVLMCTETDVDDRQRGHLAVRDGRTFELLGEFPSYGRAPHDCMLVDDGATLVVANGGSPVGDAEDRPNVAWIDARTQALRERIEVPDEGLNAGHLAVSRSGDLVLVSAPREGLDPASSPGGLCVRRAGGGLERVGRGTEVAARMLGESLSVAIHEPTRTIGVTNPTGNLVTFWSLDGGELLRELRVPNPRGIALDLRGEAFVVNFGSPPRAARVDARTLQPVDAPGNRRGYLSMATGSHILLYDIAAGDHEDSSASNRELAPRPPSMT